MRTVKVLPAAGGWVVDSENAFPNLFSSSVVAEHKAAELAGLLANLDGQAQVLVHNRDGVLISSTVLGSACLSRKSQGAGGARLAGASATYPKL